MATKKPSYNPVYASCRDVGHMWRYFRWYGWRRVLICANCDMRREEQMDKDYKVTWRRYHIPKGYRWIGEPIPTGKLRRTLKSEARKLSRWANVATMRESAIKQEKASTT